MAPVSALAAISIVNLVLYTPLSPLGIVLFIQHRRLSRYSFLRDPYSKTYLLLFSICIISLAAAALQLAAISVQDQNGTTTANDNVIGPQTAVARLFYIRLSPLLLVGLGILKRVNALSGRSMAACVTHDSTATANQNEDGNGVPEIQEGEGKFMVGSKILSLAQKLAQFALVVGLILTIIGASVSAGDLAVTGVYTIQIMTEVGVVLFVVVFAVLVSATCVSFVRQSGSRPQERYALGAMLAFIPLVLVRLVYTGLATFTNLEAFSIVYGLKQGEGVSLNGPSVVLMACMVDLTELVVVAGFLTVGFVLKRLDSEEMQAKREGSSRKEPSTSDVEQVHNSVKHSALS